MEPIYISQTARNIGAEEDLDRRTSRWSGKRLARSQLPPLDKSFLVNADFLSRPRLHELKNINLQYIWRLTVSPLRLGFLAHSVSLLFSLSLSPPLDSIIERSSSSIRAPFPPREHLIRVIEKPFLPPLLTFDSTYRPAKIIYCHDPARSMASRAAAVAPVQRNIILDYHRFDRFSIDPINSQSRQFHCATREIFLFLFFYS